MANISISLHRKTADKCTFKIVSPAGKSHTEDEQHREVRKGLQPKPSKSSHGWEKKEMVDDVQKYSWITETKNKLNRSSLLCNVLHDVNYRRRHPGQKHLNVIINIETAVFC